MCRPRALVALASIVAGVALAPSRASATQHGLFDEGWWMPVGVTVGGVGRSGGSGVVAGGEASFVYVPIEGAYFAGGYVDALHDFGNKRTRVSVGPEFGWNLLGVDAGVALQAGAGRADVGWYARGFFTLAVFSIYVRTGSFPGAPEPSAFVEAGVLLKWPFEIATKKVVPPPIASPPPPPIHAVR